MKHVIGLNGLLAAWLVLAPLALGLTAPGTPSMWNNLLVGLGLLGCSSAVAAELPGARLYALVACCCGVWLLATPFVFAISSTLAWYDVIIGAVVIVISGIEMWRILLRPVGDRSAIS